MYNTKIQSFCVLILCLVFIPQALRAQHIVSGTVIDAQNQSPLPGVNIVVKDNNVGTSTDTNGRYSIRVIPRDTLVFSFVGYQKRVVPVNERAEINIRLRVKSVKGEGVVVTGYSEGINRTDITGAVSEVPIANFEKRRVPEVAEALQGQVAGVQVTQGTGAPGDETQIRIRGQGTIGNNNPLFVIDGVPTREINFVSPGDIKSISVLKDASAAAIYGSRASGGVIIVETKDGSSTDGVTLDANYYSGISTVTNLPEMMNTGQYMNTLEEAWNNANFAGANPYTQDKGRNDFANTDWLDETFESGLTHNIYLSTSGGNEKTNYFLSSRYFTEDGVVLGDNDALEIFGFRSNVQTQITDRLNLGTNLQLRYSKEDNLNSRGESPGIIRHAMLRPPVLSIRKNEDNPFYSEEDPFTDLPFFNGPNDHEAGKYERTMNPVALATFSDDVIGQFKTFGNVFGEYGLLEDKDLKLRSNLGIELEHYRHKVFNKNFGDPDGNAPQRFSGMGRINRPDNMNENRERSLTLTWNNTVNYREEIGRHEIRVLGGTEYITNNTSNLAATRQGFDFTDTNFRYIDFGSTEQGLFNSGSGAAWTLFSSFGSVSYKYDDRYMLTANYRADASSRFAENNRWGQFPSFSAGWMVSEESFMSGIDWLTQLKLRGSWGQLGNQSIPNHAFLTLLARNTAGQFEVIRFGNPNLKWETTTQTNFGLDAVVGQLRFSTEYYNMLTSDILLPITLPEVVGEVQPTFVNSGEVRNTGFEFTMGYEGTQGAFTYDISANLSTLTNEVEKLHPNLPNISGEVTRTEVGHPINAYFGYEMVGVYQNQQEINNHLSGVDNPNAKPGDIKFKDLDGNGVINSEDRAFIGDPHPDIIYGLNLSGQYRGLDLSIFLQGVQGKDQYNDSKKILNYDTRPFNYTTEMLDSWDGEGSTNEIPRVSFTDNGGSRVSSIFVEDASYLRINSLEMGYSLDSLLGERFSAISNIRVYAAAQNLFTITGYDGLDPELTDLQDFGTYPVSRSVTFGVDTSF